MKIFSLSILMYSFLLRSTARHTLATRALRKGIRIEYVSKLPGHATIKETQVYAKIVDEELDMAMEVFNEKKPVAKKRNAKKPESTKKPVKNLRKPK